MPLSIKHDEADRLARDLARLTGESLTEAVLNSLRERLLRQRARGRKGRLRDDLVDIGRRCAALPVKDDRPADDILGYDDHGIPS
jgi:antitoxin VapB